jgi:holliday junction DNA helicase RuvA
VIASLAGTLVEKAPDRLLIEVGGVGYAVHVSVQTFTGLPPTGATVRLLVHTEVREDAIELVGFASIGERALFHLLRKVKGLGPKTCLTVLSGLPVRELVAVMAAGDTARLQTIPGVGKRLAERIIVECRDEAIKLAPGGDTPPQPAAPGDSQREEAVSALINLGYKRLDADRAVRKVGAAVTSLEDLIRAALQQLSG